MDLLKNFVSSYQIIPPSAYYGVLGIEIRKVRQEDGDFLCAVYWGPSPLSRKCMSFVLETAPSDRYDEYLKEFRFACPDEALGALKEWFKGLEQKRLLPDTKAYIRNSFPKELL